MPNEKITAQHNEGLRSADLVVQWTPGLNYVGIGLEHDASQPNHHFIDQIYGDVPTRTKIGQIFNGRMNELGWDMPEFETSDKEAEWFANLGRAVLDAITGSSETNGSWTWFDRPAINRLIRLLRKARDNAFGRDE